MTRLFFTALLIVTTVFTATAQYYYKDIVSNKQLIADMAILKEQKKKQVTVKSFEDDGTSSEGFFCEKKINKNYTEVETFNRSNVSGASLLTSIFDKNGLLVQTIDSSNIAISTSTYTYGNNNIISIASGVRSSDDDFKNEIKELHLYQYNEKGVAIKMTQIKNNTDSTVYLFSADEKNNITIEKNTKTGVTYYYYYDAKNRLTDVVRLNQFNKKMLPDYMFEYNNEGLITQMTTTEEGGSYYFIWKYTYDNGLRIKEKCFSKEKRLMGSIEYEYK